MTGTGPKAGPWQFPQPVNPVCGCLQSRCGSVLRDGTRGLPGVLKAHTFLTSSRPGCSKCFTRINSLIFTATRGGKGGSRFSLFSCHSYCTDTDPARYPQRGRWDTADGAASPPRGPGVCVLTALCCLGTVLGAELTNSCTRNRTLHFNLEFPPLHSHQILLKQTKSPNQLWTY